MQFIDAPSPHFNNRPDGTVPSLIVIHYTSGANFEESFRHLTGADPDHVVSAHYLIHEDGRIFCLVAEDKRAWHAGVGSWRGCDNVNDVSIGIEISNRNHGPYTEAQLRALTALVQDIQQRYGIPPGNVIGHSDLAPSRKQDPGYHFPWKTLAKDGIGVRPKVKLRDYFRAAAALKSPRRLRKLFEHAGYTAKDASLEQLVCAFQQHYTPEVFADGTPGKATLRMAATLAALARMQRPR